ncbi:MAG: hypothetical protein NC299_17890 [Lachnospiraceae bacterium]|nr:hypothetical protein [Ruminococcus sp.]MCM1277200.1 hypothetical protein [Lachnospiraceae bacterium]
MKENITKNTNEAAEFIEIIKNLSSAEKIAVLDILNGANILATKTK